MSTPMELLRLNLFWVRIPKPTNRIHKQECCISFDTPRSEGGLFIDMNSFLAFGKDYVLWNYEKSGNPVYLHIKHTRKLVRGDKPLKKPALLALIMDGGFDNDKPEYEETCNIIILPDFASLLFPSVELPEKVRLAVDAIVMADGTEWKDQVSSWTANKKKVSAYAMNLQQLDNGILVPPTGWKCCECDETDNLWLNLTDGIITCGRRNWDGSGGNNHSIEHYNETNYPLAVKLGTITADLQRADVFSYPEDESVEDPLLAQHLAFFGIDFSLSQKIEVTPAERELYQNTNFDWSCLRESGQEVVLLSGPGYTGLINLGNSCYLASTMQVVFSTHSFYSRYYKNQSLKLAFETGPADPTLDLNMQLAKLGHGLLSGKYSVSAQEVVGIPGLVQSCVLFRKFSAEHSGFEDWEETLTPKHLKQEGIPPRMFKEIITASHLEFSSMRQQDALEFFLHLLNQVERANSRKSELDPSRSFKFGIEERLLCSSGKVSYNRRVDYILSLNIPLHEATNKEELEAFDKLKVDRSLEGKEVSGDEIVRPRVPLEACLSNFSAPEEVHDFYSTALNAKTTVIKTVGLTSFPDYLVLHMRKFVMEESLVPKKLDVCIDVPDVIDISHMRSEGLQPGEELLPKADIDEPISQEGAAAEALLSFVDPLEVDTLVSFGFQKEIAWNSLRESSVDIEKATDYIFSCPNVSGSSDMDSTSSNVTCVDDTTLPDGGNIGEPISSMGVDEALSSLVDTSNVEVLVSFGFQKEIVRNASRESGGDINKVLDWIFSNPDAPGSSDVDAKSSSVKCADDTELPDGGGNLDEPISQEGAAAEALLSFVNPSEVDTLVSFGFQKEIAWNALRESGGDIEKAIGWIFSHPDVPGSSDVDATSSTVKCADDTALPDGGGRYKLIGLVNHIGTSTHCGHYVAHVYKEGRWVIFDDDKVRASINPPKDMGYLYFFERLDS